MNGNRPHVEMLSATEEQRSILANLRQLYAHDFSEFHDVRFGPDGKFEDDALWRYWVPEHENKWKPFLIKITDGVAGFVVVERIADVVPYKADWDMADFFVLRGFRKRKIGVEAAHQVWKQLPGRWQVRVMKSNRLGCLFWPQAIERYVGPVKPEDNNGWLTFHFAS